MTREEFLQRLEQLLFDVSEEERENALSYYTDYFEEAGVEQEQQVIKELGSPERIASIIKTNLIREAQNRESSGEFTEYGYVAPEFNEKQQTIVTRKKEKKDEYEYKGQYKEQIIDRAKSYQEIITRDLKKGSFFTAKNIAIIAIIVFLIFPMLFSIVEGLIGGVIGFFFTLVVTVLAIMFGGPILTIFGAILFIVSLILLMLGFDIMGIDPLYLSGCGLFSFGSGLIVSVLASKVFHFIKGKKKKNFDNRNEAHYNCYDNQETTSYEKRERKSQQDIQNITIDLVARNVVLQRGEGENITYYGKKEEEQIEIDGDHLHIFAPKRSLSAEEKNKIKEEEPLILILPNRSYQQLNVRMAAGNLNMSHVKMEELLLELGAGKGNFEYITVTKKIKLEIGAGNIEGKQVEFFGDILMDCGAGSVALEGTFLGALDIDCGAGNIQLDFEGKREQYSIQTRGGIGEIKVDGIVMNELFEEYKKYAQYPIQLDVGIGNVELNFHEKNEKEGAK